MAKVLSIVLGQETTRIIEVDYKSKTPRVYKCLEVATPEGGAADGYALQPKELAKEITKALKEAGIKTKKVVYSVASGRIASREATLPFVKQNKLDEIVQASASDYFPVDISEFKVTYQILDTPVDESGTKKYRVALLIAPNDLLDSYAELTKACNFDAVAIDYLPNSVSTVLKETLKDGVCMAINIRDKNTQLFIFDEGKTALSRTIPVGIHDTIATVMDLEEEETGASVSYKAAVRKLRKSSCIKNSREESEISYGDMPSPTYRIEVTDSLGAFSSSITRVMDYYNSRNVDRPIERVFLTGFAENFVGLAEYLSDEMGVNVEKHEDFESLIDFGLEENSGAFVANVGAAMDSLDLLIDSKGEKKNRKNRADGSSGVGDAADDVKYLIRGIAVCAVFLIISGVLLALSLMNFTKAKAENDRLKQQEADLMPIISVVEENVRSNLVFEDVKRMYNSTESQNDNLSLFLDELEHVLPSNVNVLSFSADQESVSVNMNVDSKEASALVIDEFRQFNSLTNVRVASVTEEVDEMGLSTVVNFTIEADYAPVIPETFEEPDSAEEE